jgi:predicted RNA-binding Zn-ribbon protein involved in translation (DUF1610 family)
MRDLDMQNLTVQKREAWRCPLCDHEEVHRSRLERHIKTCGKKPPAARAEKEHTCPDCGAKLSCRQALSRHRKKNCKHVPIKVEQTVVQPVIVRPANYTINNTVNNTVNVNLTINTFGSEDTRHISRIDVFDLIKQIEAAARSQPSLAAEQAVLSMAERIFSDPKHPHNMTAILDGDRAAVRTDAGWESRSKELVLQPMMTRSINEIFHKQPYEGLPDLPTGVAPDMLARDGVVDNLLDNIRDNEKEPEFVAGMIGGPEKPGRLESVLRQNHRLYSAGNGGENVRKICNDLAGGIANSGSPAGVVAAE